MPPDEIDTTKESVFNHKTVISLYDLGARNSFHRNDNNPDDDLLLMRYENHITVYYILHYILFPDCCAHATNRIKMKPKHEVALFNYMSKLTLRDIQEIRQKFATLEMRENENMEDGKTMSHYLRDSSGRCPFCSHSRAVYRSDHSCRCCRDELWLFLEITHKPKYWRRITENTYLSIELYADRHFVQCRKIRYYVNLKGSRKNVAILDAKVMRAMIYYGSLFADLFGQCPTHGNIEMPTLSRLASNCIALKYGKKWFGNCLHEKLKKKIWKKRLGCPSELVDLIFDAYKDIRMNTDLLEKLA